MILLTPRSTLTYTLFPDTTLFRSTDKAALAHGYLLTSTSTSSRRLALLSIGRRLGVASGQPVRGADGLIGRVLSAGPSVSQVLLLTDVDNIVPVRRARDGLPALSSGRGNGFLDVRSEEHTSELQSLMRI